MRKILVLLTIVALGFVLINRQRLYLRDPLGAVYRNNVKQEGARVFINYSNDVLVQAGKGPEIEEYLVQTWNGVPGLPGQMTCLQGMACLATADHAPMVPMLGASRAEMTPRQVSFVDDSRMAVKIVLR